MKFDADKFTQAGIVFTRDGNLIRMVLPNDTMVCEVLLDPDGEMSLVPDNRRASTHKSLVDHLKQAGIWSS